jgi:hypothetical protein
LIEETFDEGDGFGVAGESSEHPFEMDHPRDAGHEEKQRSRRNVIRR